MVVQETLIPEPVAALGVLSEAPVARECRTTAGSTLRLRELPGFTLRHTHYASGMELTSHFHERAYVSLVIQGSYRESYGGDFVQVAAGALRYLPAGEIHTNRYEADTECLLVEIQPQILDHVREASRLLDRPGEIRGVAASWLANRLFLEFQGKDPASSLALEGMLLEILAEAARTLQFKHYGPMPRWLRCAHAYLETKFLDDTRLNEVARIAGVHPVHLAREFRRHFHCSIGEFLRAHRVAHASKLLARSSTPIAEIAMICGFSDQSHFSSVFKRQMGVTPAKFREAS